MLKMNSPRKQCEVNQLKSKKRQLEKISLNELFKKYIKWENQKNINWNIIQKKTKITTLYPQSKFES